MTTETAALILAREHAQSERFQSRLHTALARVRVALSKRRSGYIAFSGGRDSLVTMALVQIVGGDIPLAWSDDELEYPESVAYMALIRDLAGPELTITLGHTTHAGWFRPWEDAPFWREPFAGSLRIEMPQDDWMARAGHDLTFLGTRADESRHRRDWFAVARGTFDLPPGIYPSRDGTGMRCCPIFDWSADDVMTFILTRRLPYNAVYDRLEAIDVPRHRQRVGPLPLSPRSYLADGWPDLLERLEARYGSRWR